MTESFGHEVVAAAYDGDGVDGGVDEERADAVVGEVAAGMYGDGHQPCFFAL